MFLPGLFFHINGKFQKKWQKTGGDNVQTEKMHIFGRIGFGFFRTKPRAFFAFFNVLF